MPRITALTALAVVAVASLGIAIWSTDKPSSPDEPVDPTPEPHYTMPEEPDDDEQPDSYDPATPVEVEANALSMRGAVSDPIIDRNHDDEIYAELEFDAADEAPERRAALNVALVVDRSGSMNGRPIEQAKKAAQTFVDGLDARDRVSLVSFDGDVTTEVASTLVDETGRATLHRAIEGLYTRGSTNLSGALKKGSREIAHHGSEHMVQRVVVLTDGRPNIGTTDIKGLSAETASIRKNGVGVSTLGFGPNYDAELLGAMATEGAGNFQHISDSADLERAFSDELDDMASTVVSGLSVDLEPHRGVVIEEVYGFSRDRFDGGERITLGDLEAGARRSAVVKLSLDRSADQPGSLRQLLSVDVDYRDRLVGNPAGESMRLDARVTDNPKDLDDSRDADVMARVEEQRSLESLREIEERYRAGDRQGAQQRIQQERKRLDGARKKHGIKEDSGAFDGVKGLLEKKEKDVKQFAPSSKGARNSTAASEDAKLDMMQGR